MALNPIFWGTKIITPMQNTPLQISCSDELRIQEATRCAADAMQKDVTASMKPDCTSWQRVPCFKGPHHCVQQQYAFCESRHQNT